MGHSTWEILGMCLGALASRQPSSSPATDHHWTGQRICGVQGSFPAACESVGWLNACSSWDGSNFVNDSGIRDQSTCAGFQPSTEWIWYSYLFDFLRMLVGNSPLKLEKPKTYPKAHVLERQTFWVIPRQGWTVALSIMAGQRSLSACRDVVADGGVVMLANTTMDTQVVRTPL